MYKLTIFFVFFYLTVSGQTTPNLERLVKVGQKQRLWCVPASLKMVLDYYNRPGLMPSQLEIYNTINGKRCREAGCGCDKVKRTLQNGRIIYSPPYSCKECDKGYSISRIRGDTLLDKIKTTYGLINSYQMDSTISWATIKTELGNNIPLIWIATTQSGNNYHAFVVFECQEVIIGTISEKWIHINDPLDICKGCSYWIRFNERNNEFIGSSYMTRYVIIPKL